ncbi:MAG: adenine deaminase [Nitrososphaerota archaeon]|nr:adenine deaminase [Nitrososphaerota archaeon]MDG7052023.1 adenine deaminase [Nitrososphaerota archaeon]
MWVKGYEPAVIGELIDTAMGRRKASLVIKNAKLVNVLTSEIEKGIDVAFQGNRIALVGNANDSIGDNTRVIEADGLYLSPGFIDGHMHIESTMLTPGQFARAVLPIGTTTIFADPHEIENVSGLTGLRYFLKAASVLPMRIYMLEASCVPANPPFETNGATIGEKEIRSTIGLDGVAGLGEVMNYEGVINLDGRMLGEITQTLIGGKVVEGHAPQISGKDLSAYIAAGVSTDHECSTKEEAMEKVRRGMMVYVREGSSELNLKEVIKAITEGGMDSRNFALCTDDRDPPSLIEQGHINYVIKRAIEEGLNPITAIQLATINPATHYGVSNLLGAIAPFRMADAVLFEEIADPRPKYVIANGMIVAENEELTVQIRQISPPPGVINTVHLNPLARSDFEVAIKGDSAKARVIELIKDSIITRGIMETINGVGGKAVLPKEISKLAVFERHGKGNNRALGFVKGFGLKGGAVASTVAHDSHNLMVLGNDDGDMAEAANNVIKMNGGIAIVYKGRALASLELPIGGLMSDEKLEVVNRKLAKVNEAWKQLGCNIPTPSITMSFLALSVLPALRITDMGLLDTEKFKFVPLIE